MLHCDCTAILDLCRAALSWVSQKNVLKIPITFCGIGFSITLVQWFHTLRIFFSLWIQRWSGCNFLYCVLFKRHKSKDTSCGLLCLWIDRWLCHGTPMDYLLGVWLTRCVSVVLCSPWECVSWWSITCWEKTSLSSVRASAALSYSFFFNCEQKISPF